jgi:hypothetical protein
MKNMNNYNNNHNNNNNWFKKLIRFLLKIAANIKHIRYDLYYLQYKYIVRDIYLDIKLFLRMSKLFILYYFYNNRKTIYSFLKKIIFRFIRKEIISFILFIYIGIDISPLNLDSPDPEDFLRKEEDFVKKEESPEPNLENIPQHVEEDKKPEREWSFTTDEALERFAKEDAEMRAAEEAENAGISKKRDRSEDIPYAESSVAAGKRIKRGSVSEEMSRIPHYRDPFRYNSVERELSREYHQTQRYRWEWCFDNKPYTQATTQEKQDVYDKIQQYAVERRRYLGEPYSADRHNPRIGELNINFRQHNYIRECGMDITKNAHNSSNRLNNYMMGPIDHLKIDRKLRGSIKRNIND